MLYVMGIRDTTCFNKARYQLVSKLEILICFYPETGQGESKSQIVHKITLKIALKMRSCN